MTSAKKQGKCPGCSGQIFPGEEIGKTPGGWAHADCVPDSQPAEPETYPECGHVRGRHSKDQQELINARGAAKIRAALAGDTAELDRLAALTPSCLMPEQEWYRTMFADVG